MTAVSKPRRQLFVVSMTSVLKATEAAFCCIHDSCLKGHRGSFWCGHESLLLAAEAAIIVATTAIFKLQSQLLLWPQQLSSSFRGCFCCSDDSLLFCSKGSFLLRPQKAYYNKEAAFVVDTTASFDAQRQLLLWQWQLTLRQTGSFL
jgi:hypothetical protein